MDKSKMMMAIIIALLVLLLGTVVGVGFYLISVSGGDTANFGEPQGPVVQGPVMPEHMRTVSLGSMTANLALGPNNRSDNLVLEVEVGINAHESVDASELEQFYGVFNRSIPIARSEVLNVLVTRTYDEIRTYEGRQETAEIMKYRLQEAFGSNLIISVHFPEWHAVRGGR
ncbi:MAG: flagellar basal body-associated FliL family protein [Defluviitaleaceae bacterium]|nr:flagellar basal body-associated FliL family protein [Defluviitaleaceae bacterium]MCL2261765.1 flagellar basal body-associated FliL family protein [Defluviitaleaceae bacterium]